MIHAKQRNLLLLLACIALAGMSLLAYQRISEYRKSYAKTKATVVNILTRETQPGNRHYFLKISFFTKSRNVVARQAALYARRSITPKTNTGDFVYAEVMVDERKSKQYKPGQHVTILYKKCSPTIVLLADEKE